MTRSYRRITNIYYLVDYWPPNRRFSHLIFYQNTQRDQVKPRGYSIIQKRKYHHSQIYAIRANRHLCFQPSMGYKLTCYVLT